MASKLSYSKIKQIFAKLLTRKNPIVLNKKTYVCEPEDVPTNAKDTKKFCAIFKEQMKKKQVESTCIRPDFSCDTDNVTVCDPLECKYREIRPDDVLDEEPPRPSERPCMPFYNEGLLYRPICEIDQYRSCFVKDPSNLEFCRIDPIICLSSVKQYPLEHAGNKPPIPGGKRVGVLWKKEIYGLRSCQFY